MKKLALSVVLLVVMSSSAIAQDNITAVTYQMSLSQGDFNDFVDDTSWIGWGIEGKHFRSPTSHWTLGFAFSWHVFDTKLYGTTELENGAVTGTQRRYVNSLPFLLTTNYYLNRKNTVKPFVGIGAGAYYIIQRLDIGVFQNEYPNWHFGIAPEVGLQFPLGEIEGMVSVKYNYAFKSGDSVQGDGQEYQYATVVVGLAYVQW
jgi:hypothetical protein